VRSSVPLPASAIDPVLVSQELIDGLDALIPLAPSDEVAAEIEAFQQLLRNPDSDADAEYPAFEAALIGCGIDIDRDFN
jgi:hypothetical protein